MGAYHSAKLPMLMGTLPNFRGRSSRLEKATSLAMQDAWVAFARGGASGLKDMEWDEYESLEDADVREFGAGLAAKEVSVADVEALCEWCCACDVGFDEVTSSVCLLEASFRDA